ncbi:uncharacterized protein RCO7_11528 [Rhynchosporium graminicola]|uniref:Protein kinase domain-containing protein n=1 Tax=Rhynchosporium graminicola TaxID=2792576 RepID=A0A1E1LDR0_9HELO|nr:uncharacterized protein RCO7_11528 [Rhynchosporium commune]
MEIAASAISITDICIRYGNILVKTCKSYKNADQEIGESCLMIEARWSKIQQQLEFLRRIWPGLEDDYQLHQSSILHLEPVTTHEGELVSALKDLPEAINSTLTQEGDADKNSVLLPDNFLSDTHYTPIQSGSTASGVWANNDGQTRYLVDQASTISTLSDVCKLAKILRRVTSFDLGILACKGVVKSASQNEQGFNTRLLFDIPSNLTNPQYLRTLLSFVNSSYPLDGRFLLAKQLAKGVMFVHSAGFVHKNIRPDTILVFQDGKSSNLWPFLTGFEKFRIAEGSTLHQGDDTWEKNLYRHPQRQGSNPETNYLMQHGIYSLGVCLLEIGLGESFVKWDVGDSKYLPSPSISAAIQSLLKDKQKKAFETKRYLVSLAEKLLPSRMGRNFTNIVATCLTCLDSSGNMFGDKSEFLDENGILVGVRFIEKVLTVLSEIKI